MPKGFEAPEAPGRLVFAHQQASRPHRSSMRDVAAIGKAVLAVLWPCYGRAMAVLWPCYGRDRPVRRCSSNAVVIPICDSEASVGADRYIARGCYLSIARGASVAAVTWVPPADEARAATLALTPWAWVLAAGRECYFGGPVRRRMAPARLPALWPW